MVIPRANLAIPYIPSSVIAQGQKAREQLTGQDRVDAEAIAYGAAKIRHLEGSSPQVDQIREQLQCLRDPFSLANLWRLSYPDPTDPRWRGMFSDGRIYRLPIPFEIGLSQMIQNIPFLRRWASSRSPEIVNGVPFAGDYDSSNEGIVRVMLDARGQDKIRFASAVVVEGLSKSKNIANNQDYKNIYDAVGLGIKLYNKQADLLDEIVKDIAERMNVSATELASLMLARPEGYLPIIMNYDPDPSDQRGFHNAAWVKAAESLGLDFLAEFGSMLIGAASEKEKRILGNPASIGTGLHEIGHAINGWIASYTLGLPTFGAFAEAYADLNELQIMLELGLFKDANGRVRDRLAVGPLDRDKNPADWLTWGPGNDFIADVVIESGKIAASPYPQALRHAFGNAYTNHPVLGSDQTISNVYNISRRDLTSGQRVLVYHDTEHTYAPSFLRVFKYQADHLNGDIATLRSSLDLMLRLHELSDLADIEEHAFANLQYLAARVLAKHSPKDFAALPDAVRNGWKEYLGKDVIEDDYELNLVAIKRAASESDSKRSRVGNAFVSGLQNYLS